MNLLFQTKKSASVPSKSRILDPTSSSSNSYLFCDFLLPNESRASCLCPQNSFQIIPNTSCQSCPSSSQSCLGLLETDVTSCKEGYSFNGQVCKECHSTCSQCVGNTDHDCIKCPPNLFLYSNGTCMPSCDTSSLLKNEGSAMFCLPDCPSPEFLHQNGSCLNKCEAPFIQITVAIGILVCRAPCSTSMYYSEASGSCIKQCNQKFSVVNMDSLAICKDLNQNFNLANMDNVTYKDSTARVAISGLRLTGVAVSSFTNPGNAAFCLTIALTKLLRYVKFINVWLPEEIKNDLNSQSSSLYAVSTTFGVPLPPSIQDKFTDHRLPPIFKDKGLSSSYLVNNWQTLSTFFISVTAGITFILFEYLMKKNVRNRNIILFSSKLSMLTKWNFFLFSSYDDMTFYSSLEFMTSHFNSPVSKLSLTMNILASSVALYLFYRVLIITKESVKQTRQVIPVNSTNSDVPFYKRWQAYQVTYAGFYNDSLTKRAYLLAFTTRIISCYLIVVLLFNHPLVQTILLNIMSYLMIFYLLRFRPIKDKFNFFVVMIYEIFILIANICLITLAVGDWRNSLRYEQRKTLGETILIVNKIADICCNISTWIFLIIGIYTAYKTNKSSGARGWVIWLNILTIPYQNSGMDYDEENSSCKFATERRKQLSAEKMILQSSLKSSADWRNSLPFFNWGKRSNRALSIFPSQLASNSEAVNLEASQSIKHKQFLEFKQTILSNQVSKQDPQIGESLSSNYENINQAIKKESDVESSVSMNKEILDGSKRLKSNSRNFRKTKLTTQKMKNNILPQYDSDRNREGLARKITHSKGEESLKFFYSDSEYGRDR